MRILAAFCVILLGCQLTEPNKTVKPIVIEIPALNRLKCGQTSMKIYETHKDLYDSSIRLEGCVYPYSPEPSRFEAYLINPFRINSFSWLSGSSGDSTVRAHEFASISAQIGDTLTFPAFARLDSTYHESPPDDSTWWEDALLFYVDGTGFTRTNTSVVYDRAKGGFRVDGGGMATLQIVIFK